MNKKKNLPTPRREISKGFVERTDAFLANPPEITDFTSFRKWYVRVAECLLRASQDKTFPFETKTANALVYAGSMILMALDKEKMSGATAGLMDRWQSLAAQVQNMSITAEQAAQLLKAADANVSINILERIISENLDAEEVFEIPNVPETRQIAQLDKRAAQHQKEVSKDEYAF